MNYLRITLLLIFFSNVAFTNPINIYQYEKNIRDAKDLLVRKKTSDIRLFYTPTIKNAQTLLLEIYGKRISDVKLTFKDLNLPFYKNPFRKNYFYALVPISYYEKIGPQKVIISYVKNKKREFTSAKLRIRDAKYKSEKIKVQKSKVNPKNNDKIRTQKEYKEAMEIYNFASEKILWNRDFILPMYSKITSEFGTKRVYNNTLKSFHSGIDFKAEVGTNIIASNSGVVKLAKNRFYAGNSIIIDHGQGVYTCYFHLSKFLVKENDVVKKGQLIGLSGDTGRITGPHLHFATRVHGVLVEPENLLSLLNSLKNR
ncbi:MAG: M23 family peptidase [Arcobacter sp.]|uniref:M23 family metallopeptidase n=1 Tax=uncultured Arcobacter sp. TaxID=165434 RepID=UPI000CC08E9A|nr:M23 family metallopeptidase [uncultured Arcobacter sp.]PLY08979.1 MAG: M23 family peptidase [Arcobacter sp.]